MDGICLAIGGILLLYAGSEEKFTESVSSFV